MRRIGMLAAVAATVLVACSNDTPAFESVATFDDRIPGDIVALRADGAGFEYVSRRTGEIFTRGLGRDVPTLLATIPVGIEGEQRGLLGHAVLDG